MNKGVRQKYFSAVNSDYTYGIVPNARKRVGHSAFYRFFFRLGLHVIYLSSRTCPTYIFWNIRLKLARAEHVLHVYGSMQHASRAGSGL